MTQEGQALPSPTPPENTSEPNTTKNATDPPGETLNEAVEDRPEAVEGDNTEEGQQEEETVGREEVEQSEEEGRVEDKDEGDEGDSIKEGEGSPEEQHHQTKRKEQEKENDNEDMQLCSEKEAADSQPTDRLVNKSMFYTYIVDWGWKFNSVFSNTCNVKYAMKHLFVSLPNKASSYGTFLL